MADGRQTQSDDKTTHGLWPGELKTILWQKLKQQ
jgi:hypothetical protein